MNIEVSRLELAELRELDAAQLSMELSEKQAEHCGLDFGGSRIIVLPKPKISQYDTEARAALRNIHEYVPLRDAGQLEIEFAELRFPGRNLEAVRQRLVTYGRDNWLALYQGVTWYGSTAEPVMWYYGDEPRPTEVRGVAHPTIYGIGGYAQCRRTIPGRYSFCFPAPELERRIDIGAAAVRELLMLANCYAL